MPTNPMMPRGSALEVLVTFFKLGLRCFGGPIAHIGYFRDELVVRRGWIADTAYGELVALCQFLPGPSSSQVGFSLGLLRAGYCGAFAAWAGFTLPSAIALTALAYCAAAGPGPVGQGVVHGLTLVAVVIVAQAVLAMARAYCPDLRRAALATLVALAMVIHPSGRGQLVAIGLCGAVGFWSYRSSARPLAAIFSTPVTRRAGMGCLIAYFGLLTLLPALQTWSPGIALAAAFYRSGALVFGGGHVVLPLLGDAFVGPGWIGADRFLAGYGAAQAMPGPLFAFAAYLGAVVDHAPNGLAGAALGLVAIFLPGLLLVVGVLPFWNALRGRTGAQAIVLGVNAAVVGLLGAALYSPLWTTTVKTWPDRAAVLAGFALLVRWRAPPWMLVVLGALLGIVLTRRNS